MNVVGITQIGDPVLRQPCKTIESFEGGVWEWFVRDLIGAAKASGRHGVAAPQVGVDWRAFAATVGDEAEPRVFNNPVQVSADPTLITAREGCLSVRDQWFDLARYAKVTISAQDEHGVLFEYTATGWDARILQHEMDHLDGILVTDRAAEQLVTLPTRQLRRARERQLAKIGYAA